MSESIRPTRRRARSSASARFAATVDLPTPPLPDATATLKRTSGRMFAGGGGRRPAPRGGGGPGALTSSRIVTAETPGERAELLRRVALDLLGRARRLRRDLEPEGDVAAADREVLHETEGDDVAREPREPDGLQDLEDLLFGQIGRCGHGMAKLPRPRPGSSRGIRRRPPRRGAPRSDARKRSVRARRSAASDGGAVDRFADADDRASGSHHEPAAREDSTRPGKADREERPPGRAARAAPHPS